MANELANAQDLVAIEDVRDKTLVLKNGGLRQVLMVGGVNFSLKSEAEQGVITVAYQNFLNGLNFPIQIIVHSRKLNIEKYLATLEGRKDKEPSGLLQDQIGEYKALINGFVADNAIMAKTFFVVVPFAPMVLPGKETVLGFLPFLKRKRGDEDKAEKAKEAQREEGIAQLKQRVTQVVEGLATVGLDAVVLEDQQLVELFYNFYNPETIEREKAGRPEV